MFERTCLKGIRVLDLTRYASGPTCTQILGDLGAEIWKVERPDKGDETRTLPPICGGESSYFHSMNRNKRSITLNYTVPEGKHLFLELLDKVDVVVENGVPGNMKKYGLDWETLHKRKPDLIMASISGFGQTDSPYCHKTCFDGIAQAMSGIMSLTGYPDRPGVKAGPSLCDLIAGHYCAIAVLGALYEITCSGEGQYIDISMLDTALACTENALPSYIFSGTVVPRLGNAHPTVACNNTFDTKDGLQSIYIACTSDHLAFTLADAIERPDLKEDPRFQTNAARSANRIYIDSAINDWTSRHTRKEITELFDKLGLPNGPVNDIADVYRDPHIWQRGIMKVFHHPEAGEIPLFTSPMKFSRTPVRTECAGPALGEGNLDIYGGILNKSDTVLQRLKREHII